MSRSGPMGLDVVILGGGAAGLWALDTLGAEGYRVLLLEAAQLGRGQTVGSQGIIHGGLKYTLGGLTTSSAQAIRDMPLVWRRSLAGERAPRLAATRRRAEFCYLWRTRSITSRVAMLGARAGLRVSPTTLPPEERPPALRRCPGVVARLDEQVIEPDSFVGDLADQHGDRILRIDADSGLEFECTRAGVVRLIRLLDPESGEPLDLTPRHVVLTAGAGNGPLRRAVGLARQRMQRRPLHMVIARGDLPEINGHCVDGMHTRVTITSTRDYAERRIWQIGGQVAEDGVAMERPALVRHARREVEAVLPGVDLGGLEWTTYRVDRAEAVTAAGRRPADACAMLDGNTISAWPTKLALVPQLVARIREHLPAPDALPPLDRERLRSWPRPAVAMPPWEEEDEWLSDV